jgi:hypothetical protein
MPCSPGQDRRLEDDLDAPTSPFQRLIKLWKSSAGKAFRFEGSDATLETVGANRVQTVVLSAEASAILREKLLTEIEGLEPQDDLDAWTFQAWQRVSALTPADGDKVREAFQAQLARHESIPDQDRSSTKLDEPAANDETRSRIDKSLLALPEPKRLGTGSICALWPNSPASSAAASPATRTICALRSRAALGKRSAMNSPSRFAARIIANCTAPARKANVVEKRP